MSRKKSQEQRKAIVFIRVKPVTRTALDLLLAEESGKAGKRLTDDKGIRFLLERVRPDIMKRAQEIVSESPDAEENGDDDE